ncbi:MAG: RidA family protein [SAR324 cluster bacterium]|nr:RidA family protein [SAR324 cluster bacterium]
MEGLDKPSQVFAYRAGDYLETILQTAGLPPSAAQEVNVGLNLLTTTRGALGSLDRVRAIVKVLGLVNAAPDFGQHPAVINGFSDLMVEVFGEKKGKHARSAVGMGSLPFQITVEIEAIVEVTG